MTGTGTAAACRLDRVPQAIRRQSTRRDGRSVPSWFDHWLAKERFYGHGVVEERHVGLPGQPGLAEQVDGDQGTPLQLRTLIVWLEECIVKVAIGRVGHPLVV